MDVVLKQLDALRTNSRNEAENQKAWGQAMESKLDQVCNNIRNDLQGSLKLAVEGLKRSITDQVMDALHKRQINEKKVCDALLATVREEQGVAHREFNEHKASIAAHLRRLDQLINKKFEGGMMNGSSGSTLSKVESSIKRMEDKFRKDLETVVGLHDRMTTLSTRSKAEVAGIKEMISDVKEQARADVDRLTDMMTSVSAQGQADVAELKELAGVINSSQQTNQRLAQQTFESLDARLRQGAERNEHWVLEVSNLKAKLNGMHGEVYDLTAAVTAQARQEIEEKYDKQCQDLQEDVEQKLRRSQTELRTEFSAIQCKKKQAILDRLPTEFEVIKTGFEEQKQVVAKRFSFIAGQIDDLSSSLRDEQRSRQDLAQEFGDRIDRKVVSVEHRLRADQQKGMDDTNLKHREAMREVQDTMLKLHSESLSRRVTEAQGLLEERIQGQLQNLQQKTSRSIDEMRSSMDRQKSYFHDHLTQETATREACEERLQVKIENAVQELNADQEALWKRCDSKDMMRQASVSSPSRHGDSSFNWEDEARRLWEALDGHTHDITSYDGLNQSMQSTGSHSVPRGRSAAPQGTGDSIPYATGACSVPYANATPGPTPSSQRTCSPTVNVVRRSTSSGALPQGVSSAPTTQGVLRHVRSPRPSTVTTVKHVYKK